MLDAHMDEVGVIITAITDSGMLKFETVGGIETEALMCKRVRFGNIVGVIGAKPIHQSSADERKNLPAKDSLYIDIGKRLGKIVQSLLLRSAVVSVACECVRCNIYIQPPALQHTPASLHNSSVAQCACG